jgi:nucleoside 2-deoxyribosyltransferase
MNIYFACSITGGRQDEATYQQLVEALEAELHHVLTAALASSDLDDLEGNLDPHSVYQRDTNWIRDCDLLIAEITTPSHGVGYEVGYALQHGKPVLCLYQAGVTVSKMITGNHNPRLRVYAYSDVANAIQFMQDFICDFANRL